MEVSNRPVILVDRPAEHDEQGNCAVKRLDDEYVSQHDRMYKHERHLEEPVYEER
jgi:hypothetical protein